MKNVRFISAALIPLFMLSYLAGCSGKKDDGNEILEDDGKSWFESDLLRFEIPSSDDKDSEISKIWKCDDRYFSVMLADAGNHSQNIALLEYDKTGKLIGQSDISLFGETNENTYVMYDLPSIMFDSKIVISCFYSGDDVTSEYYYAYDVLEKSAERLQYLESLDTDSFVQDIDRTDDGRYCTVIGRFGETDEIDYEVLISSASEVTSSVQIAEAGLTSPIKNVYDADAGKDKVDILLECDSPYLLSLNISDNKFDVSALVGTGLHDMSLSNGSAFGFNETGLYKLGEKESTPCFLFENTNIIRNLAASSSVIDANAEGIVLSGLAMFADSTKAEPFVFDVRKAADDYISGKTVITASYLNNLDDYLDEVVYEFNRDNGKYFVKLSADYLLDIDAIDESIDWNAQDADLQWDRLYAEGKSEIIDRLAMNLVSGDGPDIVFNAGNCSRLLSDEYFTDLASLVDRDMDKSDFFSTLFEDAHVDGKLYFLPLSFYIRGLTIDSRYAKDGSGISFAEYAKLVDEVCNGIDPMEMSRKDCFMRLFDNECDLFVKGKRVNFNCDEFKQLATFCFENIPEQLVEDSAYEGTLQASADIVSDFSSYMEACKISSGKMTRAFTGYPSSDERGPSAVFYNDVAIAAKASDKDGAWEFLKYLLGNESQIKISASKNEIPISRTAYETRIMTEYDDYQKMIDEARADDKTAASRQADEAKIEEFMGILDSTTLHLDCDPSVRIIVSEEIDAYFAGQKSIDQVADIIQNRASTVLSEKD